MGVGVGGDKDLRQGRSRKQARRNKAMRRALFEAFDRLLDQCLREGWYGDFSLHAHVEDGIVQRNYTTEFRQVLRWR
jgi:hypothetical protein